MGGFLKVIVRFSDGDVVAETRGTNNLPFWVRNPRFIEGDEGPMREYVALESGFRTGDRSYAPSEYGTFAIDYLTRTIAHANGYFDPEQVLIHEGRTMGRRFGVMAGDEGKSAFAELLAGGYIRVESQERSPRNPHASEEEILADGTGPAFIPHRVEMAGVTPETWDERVYEPYSPFSGTNSAKLYATPPSEPGYEARLEFKGWTVISLDEGIEGQDEMQATLRRLGFPYPEEHARAYADWRAEEVKAMEDEAKEEAEDAVQGGAGAR